MLMKMKQRLGAGYWQAHIVKCNPWGKAEAKRGLRQLPRGPNQTCHNCCELHDLRCAIFSKVQNMCPGTWECSLAGVRCVGICKTDSHSHRMKQVHAYHEIAADIKEDALGFGGYMLGHIPSAQAVTNCQHSFQCVLSHGLRYVCKPQLGFLGNLEEEEEEEEEGEGEEGFHKLRSANTTDRLCMSSHVTCSVCPSHGCCITYKPNLGFLGTLVCSPMWPAAASLAYGFYYVQA